MLKKTHIIQRYREKEGQRTEKIFDRSSSLPLKKRRIGVGCSSPPNQGTPSCAKVTSDTKNEDETYIPKLHFDHEYQNGEEDVRKFEKHTHTVKKCVVNGKNTGFESENFGMFQKKNEQKVSEEERDPLHHRSRQKQREDEAIVALALVSARGMGWPKVTSSDPLCVKINENDAKERLEISLPLRIPKPHGCQSRIGPNCNSYCGRYPCFMGSRYCELHHHQEILLSSTATIAHTISTNVNTRDAATKAMARQMALSGCDSSLGLIGNKKRKGANGDCLGECSTTNQNLLRKNKKFTDSPIETRCRATTTRGRLCMYVSVNGTPYCHLHSDYDTNPPTPRRKFKIPACTSSLSSDKNEDKDIEQKRPTQLISKHTKITTNGTSGPGPPPPLLQRGNEMKSAKTTHNQTENEYILAPIISPSNQNQKQNFFLHTPSNNERQIINYNNDNVTHNILSNMHSSIISNLNLVSSSLQKSEKPNLSILSSIGPSRWQNQRVRITVGPLARHTGRILRWGNGWVTLRTHAGLHNRRAFELEILPESVHSREEYDLKEEPDESIWLLKSDSDAPSKRKDTNNRSKQVVSDHPRAKLMARTTQKKAAQSNQLLPQLPLSNPSISISKNTSIHDSITQSLPPSTKSDLTSEIPLTNLSASSSSSLSSVHMKLQRNQTLPTAIEQTNKPVSVSTTNTKGEVLGTCDQPSLIQNLRYDCGGNGQHQFLNKSQPLIATAVKDSVRFTSKQQPEIGQPPCTLVTIPSSTTSSQTALALPNVSTENSFFSDQNRISEFALKLLTGSLKYGRNL